MNNELKEIMKAILFNYKELNFCLPNSRLTKIIYLSDWLSCIRTKKPISNIHWYFDNYGPYVEDVIDCAKHNPQYFKIHNGSNIFGAPKKEIELIDINEQFKTLINKQSLQIIETIVEVTKDLSFKEFISFVYSTYPVLNTNKYNDLNLQELALDAQGVF